MNATACPAPVPPATLESWWLGELGEPASAQVEEHLFGCAACSAELQRLADLARGIRGLVCSGRLPAVVSAGLPGRMAEAGLRVRNYSVVPGGSVLCTVAPDDDLVISHLQAPPLAGIERLDVTIHGLQGDEELRLADVPFGGGSGEVVVVPPIDAVRALPATTVRMRLIAAGPGPDRVIGEYTFHHTPWAAPTG